MKAFVTYSYKTKIRNILNILKEVEVEFFDGKSDLNIGDSFQEAISRGIKNCDFFIAIYESSNANIAFEAGLAYALKKPMFVIINPNIGNDIPDFLMDSVHVFAHPSDYEKIKYNFDIFIRNIKPSKSGGRKKSEKKDKPSREKSNNEKWLRTFNSIDFNNEIRLEKFIGEILKDNQVDIIKDKWSSHNKYFSDYCIWSDHLDVTFGNPILIEVKKTLSKQSLDRTYANVKRTLSNTNAKSIVIFYNELADITENELNSYNTKQLVYISIYQLLKGLEKNDFNKALLKCRNDLIHTNY